MAINNASAFLKIVREAPQLKAISFKNELENSFLQKFADYCSQQKFVYQIRAIIFKGKINMLQTEKEQPIVIVTNL